MKKVLSILVIGLTVALAGCAKTEQEKVKDANKAVDSANTLFAQGKANYGLAVKAHSEAGLGSESSWTPEQRANVRQLYVKARDSFSQAKAAYDAALTKGKDVKGQDGVKSSWQRNSTVSGELASIINHAIESLDASAAAPAKQGQNSRVRKV